jgi:hypothetical protein
LNNHSIPQNTPIVNERCHKPTGLGPERGVRESEEGIFSSRNIDSFFKDVFESTTKNLFVGNARIKPNRLSIFVTKLNSKEVVMMIRVLSKNSIVGFSLGPVEVDCCGSNFDSVNDCNIIRCPRLSIHDNFLSRTLLLILLHRFDQFRELEVCGFGIRSWEFDLVEPLPNGFDADGGG